MAGTSISPSTPASDEPVPYVPRPFEARPMTSVPLLGGTLEAAPEIGGAIAADPEGNRLLRVDAAGATELDLGDNARPFRIEVEGPTAWATLRGTGEVVEVDLPSLSVTWRTKVCPEPRGLDHAPDGTLVVACAGGELVGLAPDGTFSHAVLLKPDLRDVVVSGEVLYVSRFRAGEVLLLDPTTFELFDVAPLDVAARVVWRMRAAPDSDGVVVAYDRVDTDPVTTPDRPTTEGIYGTQVLCQGMHQTAFATVGPEGFASAGSKLDSVVLPVDFVLRDDGTTAIVNGASGGESVRGDLLLVATDDLLREGLCVSGGTELDVPGSHQPAAVAEIDGVLVAQTMASASVAVVTPQPRAVWDAGLLPVRDDEPFGLFHRDPGAGIACASCHPEGGDDGNVWTFGRNVSGVALPGPRRTLPLAGGASRRAPYHWMGELATQEDLLHSTFTVGMGGPGVEELGPDLFAWLDGLRPVHATTAADDATLAQGEELFEQVGCASCHGGEDLTDNALHEVRAGGTFKTPTLVGLGLRTSFMHDGCARTLEERLVGPESCTGGDAHGVASVLTDEEVAALVSYLETL